MGKATEERVFYLEKKGPVNTERALEIALACCEEKGIRKIVVASSTGKTALLLRDKAKPSIEVIGVTYSAGSKYREEVEEFNRNRETMVKKGIQVVRGLHALSATERAFENKYKSGLLPLNIVADTLRMFSQGMKVCLEVAVMAAEAGFVTPDEDIVVLGGSGKGADTAVIMKPAYAASMFETKFKAVLCMPG
ncbi:MAG: pyruvate kinase alpha/beta domain-containing protein [Deltaproteobacteria bacterium]